jgi:flavorubredoxin
MSASDVGRRADEGGARPVNPLPREIGPGVYWLGKCLTAEYEGRTLHLGQWCYLVVGDRHCALVEAGDTGFAEFILGQLEQLLARGLPDLRYVFVTHTEMAHAGGLGHLLDRFPDATVHGDVSDLHLVFPQFAERQHFAEPGERFDLGGTEIAVVESVFRDLVCSRWFFDTRSRVLFTGDGFAYGHYHADAACGHFVEEAPDLDMVHQMRRYGVTAFHWTQYVDIEPFIERLDELLLGELDVNAIAPGHGLPIGDPRTTMPQIEAGLRGMRLP